MESELVVVVGNRQERTEKIDAEQYIHSTGQTRS